MMSVGIPVPRAVEKSRSCMVGRSSTTLCPVVQDGSGPETGGSVPPNSSRSSPQVRRAAWPALRLAETGQSQGGHSGGLAMASKPPITARSTSDQWARAGPADGVAVRAVRLHKDAFTLDAGVLCETRLRQQAGAKAEATDY